MLPNLSGLHDAPPTGEIAESIMLMTKPKAREMSRELEAEFQQFKDAEQRLEDREVGKYAEAYNGYRAGDISRPELLQRRKTAEEQIQLMRAALDEKGQTYEALHRQLYDRGRTDNPEVKEKLRVLRAGIRGNMSEIALLQEKAAEAYAQSNEAVGRWRTAEDRLETLDDYRSATPERQRYLKRRLEDMYRSRIADPATAGDEFQRQARELIAQTDELAKRESELMQAL